jgi:hypothetical protein
MPFACSICGEESTRICARCTKDACDNHLCARCQCCSDCCECEVALDAPAHEPARPAVRPVSGEPEIPRPEPELEPDPEPAAGIPAEEFPPATEPEQL